MPDRITRCRPLLGTFVEITADTEASIDSGFDAIARVHRLMSAHEPGSELSRINRFAHLREIETDPWTALVLERAIHWSKQSEGVFDVVAAGALAMASGYLPRHRDQPEPQAAHWSWIELRGSVVRLLKPACLDLGGIAKGFAVDRAAAALKSAGAAFGLVNAGGDIAGFGPLPWPVQVVQPATRRAIANVAVSNGAIATSSVLPDGRDDHLHERDASLISATVCAPNAMDADALTKIVLAGSPAAARCLELADAQAFVLDRSGGIGLIEAAREAA